MMVHGSPKHPTDELTASLMSGSTPITRDSSDVSGLVVILARS